MRALVVLLGLIGCERKADAPAEPPRARSTPFAPVSAIIASATASASAAPGAKPSLPGIPSVETSCTKDADCAVTFYDDTCCNQCEPRIGSKTWTIAMNGFCTKPANRNAECKAAPCGFAFGAPRCNAGQCASR